MLEAIRGGAVTGSRTALPPDGTVSVSGPRCRLSGGDSATTAAGYLQPQAETAALDNQQRL
jgi:hypothetical protein